MVGKVNLDKQEILKACRQVEMAMANIYFALSKVHEGVLDLSALWKKTAREEENHARQFDSALRNVDNIVDDVKTTREEAEQALERASAMLRRVQTEALTPVDCLTMAIDMEQELSEFHLHLAATFQRESDKKMFMAMMAADKHHVRTLKEELDKRSQA